MTTPRLPGLTLDDARSLVEATIEIGREHGFAPLAVAAVDVAGEVIVLHRADGARPLTSRVAVAKARTCLVSLMSSGETAAFPEGIAFTLRAAYGGDFVTRAGGLPVVRDGVVVGALGASGAASEQDEEAARLALERWAGGA